MGRVLTGKWQWNGEIKPMYAVDHGLEHYVWFKSGFKSNGQRYEGIRFIFDEFWRLEYTAWSGYVGAGEGHYEDDYATPFEQYRVIDFGTGSEADDDSDGTFVEWFLSNVTRYGTVAEMLVQIAENEKAVYQSGYDKALEKGGYKQGFEDGKQAEYDAFWDAFQKASRKTWANAFQDSCWNDDTFYPKYDLIPTGNAASLFRYCGISDLEGRLIECGVILDTSGATSLNCGFGECSKITAIPTLDLTKCTTSSATSGLFGGCVWLKTIRKIIVSEATVITNSFQNCPMLENIVFDGVIGNDINFQWSTKLTEASIKSIIEHLSLSPSIANGKTLTLSKDAVDAAIDGYIWSEEHQSPIFVTGRGSETETWEQLIAPAKDAGWNISLVV